MAGPSSKPTNPRVAGIASALQRAETVALVGPPGLGKTTPLNAAAAHLRATTDRVPLSASIAGCEGHVGLFVDSLLGQIAAALGADAATQISEAREGTGGVAAVAAALAALPRPVALLLDDADTLEAGAAVASVIDAWRAIAGSRFALALAGRRCPAHLDPTTELGVAALTLTEDEIAAIAQSDARSVDAVVAVSGGWPAIVSWVIEVMPQCPEPEVEALLAAVTTGQSGERLRELAADVIAPLRPEAQLVACVAAIFGTFTPEAIKRVFGGDVPGSPQARRRLVRLPDATIDEALGALATTGAVRPSAGERQRFNPAIARSLSGMLARRDHEAHVEAHRRVAEVSLADGADVAAAVDALLVAGEYGRADIVLAGAAPALARSGATRRLRGWLETLAEHRPETSVWAPFYLARALTSSATPEAATPHLDRARELLRRGSHEADELALWHVRLAHGYADVLWRRGAYGEAQTWARRGVDELDTAAALQGRAEMRATRAELVGIAARSAAEVGSLPTGRAALEAARASHAGGDVGMALVATCLRAGDVDSAARFLSEEPEGSAWRAGLEAWMAALLGSDAVAPMAAEAIARARATVDISDGVEALLAAAAAYERANDDEAALPALREAAALAAKTGRTDLNARATYRLAIGLGRVGDAELADLLGSAGAVGGDALTMEGYAAALQAEAQALEWSSRETTKKRTLAYAEVAAERYSKLGARVDAANLHGWLAELADARAGDDANEADATVMSEVAAVARIAADLRVSSRALRVAPSLFAIGARRLEDAALKQACERALEALGWAPGVDDAGAELVARHCDPVGRAIADAANLMTTRRGVVPMDDAAVRELAAAPPGDRLTAFVAEGFVANYGEILPLQQKRVMMPLLLVFLGQPEGAFSQRDLARLVWGASTFDSGIQTKVKVSVSRLRKLLGKGRAYIDTTRKEEGGRSVVAYQLAPDLDFAVVGPVQA